MKKTKYIFLDIDGTLLDSNGYVCDSTRLALEQAKKNGHKVFVCSGRARKLIPPIIEDLDFNGFVAGTGSFVEFDHKIVYEKYFSREQVDMTIDYFNKNNMPFIMSAKTTCVGPYSDVPLFVEVFSEGKIKAEDIGDIDDIDNPFFESIKPITCDDDIKNYFNKFENVTDFIFIKSPVVVQELDKLFGADLHVEKASFKNPDDYSGEVTLSDCSKATGIQKMLEYLGASQEDSICIGDGFNDVDMLKYCNLSIAMGNSPDEIKQLANYVTDDVMHDGVYNAMKNFDLI